MEFNIFTFPYEQIGNILRQMSLSGGVGNVFSIIIYVVVGLIPTMVFFYFLIKKKLCKLDWALPVISIFLFGLLYYMINPGLIIDALPGAGTTMMCYVFVSVLVTYLILRIITICKKAESDQLKQWIRIFLWGVMILFGILALLELFNFPAQWGIAIANIVTYAMEIWVIYRGIQLLDAMLIDVYCQDVIIRSEILAKTASTALAVMVLTSMGLNVFQYLFRNILWAWQINVHVNVTIPVFSIVFLLLILLFAKFIQESQKLKEDNDLFI